MDPCTPHQRRELTRLASVHGKAAPKAELSREEAEDAIRALRRLPEPGAKSALPAEDPFLQPHETLRDWHPYRRTGQSRGQGEQLA